jgi:hypothetical protein
VAQVLAARGHRTVDTDTDLMRKLGRGDRAQPAEMTRSVGTVAVMVTQSWTTAPPRHGVGGYLVEQQ